MRSASKLNDFSRRECERDRQVLGYHSNLASHFGPRHGVKDASLQEDRTFTRRLCAAQEFQERCFSRTIGTEDGDPLAGADVEKDAAEDRRAAVIEARLRNMDQCHA